MFDSAEESIQPKELPAVSTARLAGLIEQNHAELVSAECRMLQLACGGLSSLSGLEWRRLPTADPTGLCVGW